MTTRFNVISPDFLDLSGPEQSEAVRKLQELRLRCQPGKKVRTKPKSATSQKPPVE